MWLAAILCRNAILEIAIFVFKKLDKSQKIEIDGRKNYDKRTKRKKNVG